MRRAAAILLVLAASAPAEARDRTTIARTADDSPLATYGGVTAVSVREGDRYALAIVRGDRLRRLDVERSDYPFDADVGPDTKGRPVLVYSRDGDLVIHRLGRGGEEPVRTASTPDADEWEPSVWRGRIAWATDRGAFTRNRLLARTAPSLRVAGGDVDEVEVRGRLVATIAKHGRPHYDVPPQRLRLFDVASRRGRLVWRQGAGIAAQRLHGLSFAGPWLGWHRTCDGDEAGCDNGGPRRFHLRDRRYEWWTAWRALSGFALLPGGRTLEIATGGRLQRLAAPRWRPIPGY